jgi:hypothetical protein
MKLIDLQPAWLSPDVFVFVSPAGRGDLVTCKRVAMPKEDQYALVYEKNPQYVGRTVVMTAPDMVWQFEGDDFATMTVAPSVDHSPSGNWHGFIRNGEIVFL